jgi:hypothetical protein
MRWKRTGRPDLANFQRAGYKSVVNCATLKKQSDCVLLSGVVPEQACKMEKAGTATAAARRLENAMSWTWHTATASR